MKTAPALFRSLASGFASSLAVAACVWPVWAQAQTAVTTMPFGQLSFTAPTGTAVATDVIDVWARFTLDTTSAPLNFTSQPLLGFDQSLLPIQGNYFPPVGNMEVRDFATWDGAVLNTRASCSGNFFTATCDPAPTGYTFNFHFGPDNYIPGLGQINLQPGNSVDFILGRFTPTSGSAAPGLYNFNGMGLTLTFYGTDGFGNTLFSNGIDLASCSSCDFSRTVTAVPEPASVALMLAGLAGLGFVARRKGPLQPA